MFSIMGFHGYFLLFLACLGPVYAAGPDDFSSNLFSDIAPLIALFGEQVAKQYLSQSLGFLENLIFACAPLGILTAVTCAIRVGGPVALRALIGRAQEPAVQVELDLLRSTSSDVCELWDGRQIVRLTGSPDIVELVYDENGAVYTRDEVMRKKPRGSAWWRPFSSARGATREFELQELDELVSESHNAPNISLNGGAINVNEVRLVAFTALTLQLGVVLFFFFSVYNLDLSNSISSDSVPNSALPLTVAGALAVTTGVFICTAVVEARTRLTRWVPKDKSHSLRIMWLQKAQILGDQHFQACAIFADKSRHEIVSSVYDSKRNLEIWTCFGTAITTIGFICQLIGRLRQMHYAAAVAQFVATVIMSILRVVIRRHYTRQAILDYDPTQPLNTFGIAELSDGHEFSEIAKRLSRCKSWIVYTGFNVDIHGFSKEANENSLARKALQNRLMLTATFEDFWFSDESTSSAFKQLVRAVEDTINKTIDLVLVWHFNASIDTGTGTASSAENEVTRGMPCWTIEVATVGDKSNLTKLKIPLKLHENSAFVDKSDVEAVLGMWLAQLYQNGLLPDWTPRKGNNMWLLPFADGSEYEIWQVMLEFLVPGWPKLIPVGDVLEVCEQNQVEIHRVFHTSPASEAPNRATRRAIITETDILGMCGQYLAMSFFSQNVPLLKKRHKDPVLDNTIRDISRRHVRIEDPLFEEISDCFLRTSISHTSEDAKLFAFCVLCQTGDFPDPLLLLPDILKQVTTFEKDEATKVCSRIRTLLEWKSKKLLAKNLRVEAAETCLITIGAFNEGLGWKNAETQKLRDLVAEIISEPVIVCPDMNVSGLFPANTPVEGNLTESPNSQNEGCDETMNWRLAMNEDGFNALVTTGDVESLRTSLVLKAIDDPVILNNLLMNAFLTTQASITFDRTEIIRLIILSGSGCETYQFNSSSLMGFAVEVGNISLVELIIKKEGKKMPEKNYNYEYLRTAIRNGHVELVKILLKFGDHVDSVGRDNDGVTALCTAALHGQEAITRHLLSVGASVKHCTQSGQNALSFAARNNHNAVGKLLIDEELKASSRYIDSHGIGFQYDQGRTSLHLVAAEGNVELVSALLEAGWDLNGGGCQFTPVMDAIYRKREQVAKFLIEKGSRVDPELLTPAAQFGMIDLVGILLRKGVDVNAPSHGKTALEVAVNTMHNPERRLQLVKLLLNKGADFKTNQAESLVLKATGSGLEDVAIFLIGIGAPFEGMRDGGTTIVHHASELGYIGVIRALVAKGAQLSLQDNHGRTALHLAAYEGHTELMNVLLQAELSDWVDRKNKSECTALHDAVRANQVEAARVLVEHGASMTSQTYPGCTGTSPLAQAVRDRHAEIVQLFIDNGVTLDEEIHGNIVRDAIGGGDLPTIKALLSIDSKASPMDHRYATEAIHLAIQRNKVDAVKLLLELGAEITDGEAFRFALHYGHGKDMAAILYNHNPGALFPFVIETYLRAAAENRAETIRFWLKNNIPVDVKNKDRETALHIAARKLAKEALGALLEGNPAQEFVNARSNTGATALYAVVDNVKGRYPEETLKIIRLLVEHGANHRIGVIETSPARAHLATPREYALSLGLSNIIAYFDEIEKKEG